MSDPFSQARARAGFQKQKLSQVPFAVWLRILGAIVLLGVLAFFGVIVLLGGAVVGLVALLVWWVRTRFGTASVQKPQRPDGPVDVEYTVIEERRIDEPSRFGPPPREP